MAALLQSLSTLTVKLTDGHVPVFEIVVSFFMLDGGGDAQQTDSICDDLVFQIHDFKQLIYASQTLTKPMRRILLSIL